MDRIRLTFFQSDWIGLNDDSEKDQPDWYCDGFPLVAIGNGWYSKNRGYVDQQVFFIKNNAGNKIKFWYTIEKGKETYLSLFESSIREFYINNLKVVMNIYFNLTEHGNISRLHAKS